MRRDSLALADSGVLEAVLSAGGFLGILLCDEFEVGVQVADGSFLRFAGQPDDLAFARRNGGAFGKVP